MLNKIKQHADEIFEQVVNLRRTIHANPELAFEEFETAKLIAETLAPLDVEVQEGVAKTGLVVTIKGGKPGPTIALRADMDALPIIEENTFDFVSKNHGKMHACGHDMHTSSMLGTAMILSKVKDEIPGTIRLLFQPSEEKLPGGAKVMIEEGVLAADFENSGTPAPESIFGQHVFPDLAVGKIGICSGMYMSSVDEIYLTITGQGGHAATPHKLGADPVLAMAHTIVALQSVISRHCPPDVPSVLSFGKVKALGATNVIPGKVTLAGTFRAMDPDWRFKAHKLIEKIAKQTANAYGSECEVKIITGYPALYNTPGLADHVAKAAADYVGKENVVALGKWFASEDFAWYTQKIPGAFYRIGVRNEAKGIIHGVHTPNFTIDEESLRLGPGFMAWLAVDYLQSKHK